MNYVLDITDLKAKEKDLEQALDQKDLLLKELYHRTKNNMQVVASMLRLKSRTIKEEEQKEYFLEMVNKINSMSLVHQKLYSAQDLSHINFKDYLNDFLRLLSSSYMIDEKRIKLELDLKDVFTSVDTSIPLGLVITELISNVFKHAFPAEKKGVLKIKLLRDKENKLLLKIEDNGVGLPAGMDLKKESGLGLKNAVNLVEYQLKGQIDFVSRKGVQWEIIIDDNKTKKRI